MDPDYWAGKRVVVTGGAGFLGSYVVDNLIHRRGVHASQIVVPRSHTHDLRKLDACLEVLAGARVVIHLAAITGGVGFARAHPASQYFECSLMDMNVAEAARRTGVQKLVTLGNLFAYSADAPLPLTEDHLFLGAPSAVHRGIGSLKRNLALLSELFHREYGLAMVVIYSANAYGPRDSLDPVNSHVIPSLIMKCLRDRELVVWGDGTPTRDFLFAEDVAEALLLASEALEAPAWINIGSEREISIRDLVDLIVRRTGFQGPVTFDATRGGGEMRRLASAGLARAKIGFRPQTPIEEGLKQTVEWYRQQMARTLSRDDAAAGKMPELRGQGSGS